MTEGQHERAVVDDELDQFSTPIGTGMVRVGAAPPGEDHSHPGDHGLLP